MVVYLFHCLATYDKFLCTIHYSIILCLLGVQCSHELMITFTYLQVHACDVVAKMIAENVKNVNDFEWISQLRQVNIKSTLNCGLMVNS